MTAAGRLDTAAARMSAAQAKAAQAARELTAAEQELRDAQADVAASQGENAAATERLVAADAALADAQKTAAGAAKGLADAEAGEAAALKAAAAAGDAQAAAQLKVKGAASGSGATLAAAGKAAGVMALGLGVAGGIMVKAAGSFQDATTHLVTDAGESQKNLSMVQAGILKVSSATGQSANDINNAMYHIESSGLHGAAGLKVLQTAAEGARVGGADLDTVSKTLVGTLTAYYGNTLNASNATQRSTALMNQLVATVGSGDMRMQDLASSLSNVAPLAAASGISFAQVGGAIATMTAQGMSASQATQDLSNTIRNLSNPTHVATTEMAQLGVSSQDVQQHLGQRGLTGTISLLTRAITSHMGKAGQVLMSAFNQSTAAAQDANIMLSKLPPSIRAMAKGYEDGTVSYKTWNAATKNLPLTARTMADQLIGIWNGLASMGSWLWSKVTGWASGVLGSIKSAFGIGSPSKYTTVHGQMLGAGIAGGLLSSLPQVLAAARQVTSSVLSVTGGLSASTAGRVSLASGVSLATAAGAAGGGTVVNLTINEPHIMSDRDMDQFVNKIGRALSTKVLPQAGVKVRMG